MLQSFNVFKSNIRSVYNCRSRSKSSGRPNSAREFIKTFSQLGADAINFKIEIINTIFR